MNKDTLKETVDGLKRLASPSAEIFTDGERLTSFISLAQKLPDLDEIIQQAKEEEREMAIEIYKPWVDLVSAFAEYGETESILNTAKILSNTK